MRITPHQAHQGFLTIAQNTEINYLKLAYVQAMSIKLTMPDSLYAVIVDEHTEQQITEDHKKVFDYIITLPHDYAKDQTWKLSNEWQVFYLTPFKETIKLESDLIFTRSIKHWWTVFRLKNIVLSYGCRDYAQNISTSRHYRKLFDDNELPDVYNGLMYFRYSQEANDFFIKLTIFSFLDQNLTNPFSSNSELVINLLYKFNSSLVLFLIRFSPL